MVNFLRDLLDLEGLISIFFLILLFGLFVTVDQIKAQVSTDCDRHTFSLVECTQKETDNAFNGDLQNIEESPLMIPFP